MSEPGRDKAEAGLRGAVRPFRRAAFELTAPLAGLEVALGAASALTAVLEPALGQLDVSPFGSLELGEGGAPGAGETRSAAAGARKRRPGAPRSARTRRASPPSAPASAAASGNAFSGIARAIEQIQRDAAVSQAAEKVVPGTGPAAAAIARGVRTAASLPLLGELADAALDAVSQSASPPAAGARAGRSRSAAPAPGDPLGSRLLGGVPAPPAARGNAFSGIARALEQIQQDAAVSAAAEKILPGTGRTAVALAHGAQAATSLLEQLAETALEAVAPTAAAPEPVASKRKPRTDAAEAVRRELDASGARPGRPAPATPTRPGRSPDGATPAPDGARPPEPPDPAELAWLVNEALVEQARRHGVDLS